MKENDANFGLKKSDNSFQPAGPMRNHIEVASVSWIDRKNLPTPGVANLAGALIGGRIGWDDRTVIGLIATSNATPPQAISNFDAFRSRHQFRSLALMRLKADQSGLVGQPVLDPGWTPPFDKSKLPMLARAKDPPPQALTEHAGESSALSAVACGRRLPSSVLALPSGAEVVADMMIKFRAGEATNKLGLEEADSPFHVPWVWCETMIVRAGGALTLLACGSQFPSHAWYVNGTQVAATLQKMVHAKPDEPAISTGRPKNLPRLDAHADKSEGTVTSHQYTVQEGRSHSVDIDHLVS